ncbi:MAG: recombination mediator RecR [Acidobacteriota bacterium]|jgi:recombination protein RecR|nr:recombination mediator RecR [Acidobacteriota bacterium]
MLRYAAPLERVVQELERLPGIGPKSAQRLAMHLMRMNPPDVQSLGESILELRRALRECRECFNYSVDELCPICQDTGRDRSVLSVVEQPGDLMALERSGEYRGLYHILGGALSPLDGTGHEDLHIDALMERIMRLQPAEVILATSPTVDGDATAEYLRKLIEGLPIQVTVTRIAQGLPMGGDLDYADQVTIARALRGRRPMGD